MERWTFMERWTLQAAAGHSAGHFAGQASGHIFAVNNGALDTHPVWGFKNIKQWGGGVEVIGRQGIYT